MTLLEIFSYILGFMAIFTMAWSCILCEGAKADRPWNKGGGDHEG